MPASCAIRLRPNAPTRLGSSRAPVAKVGCRAAPRTGAGASDRDDRTRWVEEICRRAKRESRVRFSGAGRWRHGESRSRRCRLPGVRRHASRRFSVDRRLIPQRPADAPLRGQVRAPSASHSRKWRGHGRGDGQSSGVFCVSLGPRPRAPTEYGFRPSPFPTAWTIRCRNQDHTNQNATQRRNTYTAYGIGCAAVWAASSSRRAGRILRHGTRFG